MVHGSGVREGRVWCVGREEGGSGDYGAWVGRRKGGI